MSKGAGITKGRRGHVTSIRISPKSTQPRFSMPFDIDDDSRRPLLPRHHLRSTNQTLAIVSNPAILMAAEQRRELYASLYLSYR